jgi:hypothetical protein
MQRNFSSELHKIEPKHFTPLPASCATTKEFILPHTGDKSGKTLLWPLFDLIRHGLAHQYQQIIVGLNDGKHFYISLTGVDYGRYLDVATNLQRPREHLGYTFDKDGDLGLKIYPDSLFLDFEQSINKSGVRSGEMGDSCTSSPYAVILALSLLLSSGNGIHACSGVT